MPISREKFPSPANDNFSLSIDDRVTDYDNFLVGTVISRAHGIRNGTVVAEFYGVEVLYPDHHQRFMIVSGSVLKRIERTGAQMQAAA